MLLVDIQNATAYQLVKYFILFDKSNKKSLISFSIIVFGLFKKSLRKYDANFCLKFRQSQKWEHMLNAFETINNQTIEDLQILESIEDELTSIVKEQDLKSIEKDLDEIDDEVLNKNIHELVQLVSTGLDNLLLK